MDLRFLKGVVAASGPFVTVYLDVSHNTEDAEHQLELRWSAAREALAEQGADASTLDLVQRAVLDADPVAGRAGRVVVGQPGQVLLDHRLPDAPEPPSARWGPLPDLLPMLVQLPEPVPALVVRVDETGGEILFAAPDTGLQTAEDVSGRQHPVHKARGGGWSHLNMQERVEETWRQNTAQLAERVDAHLSSTGARLVVLAGTAPSRSRLRDALSQRAAALAVEVEHSGGADHDELAAAVTEATRDAATAERHAVLERYDQAAGRPDGLAVDGLHAVLAALRAQQVEILLVDGGVDRDSEVWVGAAPNLLAADEEELRAMGAEPIGRAPVDAAIVRAAAGSDADFYPIGGGRTGLVGHPVSDGVAALLRYPLVGG